MAIIYDRDTMTAGIQEPDIVYQRSDRLRPRYRPCETSELRLHGITGSELQTFNLLPLPGWLGSRVVSVLNSGTEGPGFKSQSRRCRVTVLGKLFTPIVPLFTKQQN